MNPDISSLDPAPAPTTPTSGDLALTDVLGSDRTASVQPNLLPAKHRPFVGWLIGAGVVIVAGGLIAALSIPSAVPSVTSSEPSNSAPTPTYTFATAVQVMKFVLAPVDGSTPQAVMVQGPDGGNYTITATEGGSDAIIWFFDVHGTVLESCSFPTNIQGPVSITVTVGDDGTVTCTNS